VLVDDSPDIRAAEYPREPVPQRSKIRTPSAYIVMKRSTSFAYADAMYTSRRARTSS